jgi:hypothetical protein
MGTTAVFGFAWVNFFASLSVFFQFKVPVALALVVHSCHFHTSMLTTTMVLTVAWMNSFARFLVCSQDETLVARANSLFTFLGADVHTSPIAG